MTVRAPASTPSDTSRMLVRARAIGRLRATGVVAEAVTLAARIQAEHAAADLNADTAATEAAARRTAAAARRAREVRLQAATEAAEAIAAHAARTAVEIKVRAGMRQPSGLPRPRCRPLPSSPPLADQGSSARMRRSPFAWLGLGAGRRPCWRPKESAGAAVRVASAVTAAAAVVAVKRLGDRRSPSKGRWPRWPPRCNSRSPRRRARWPQRPMPGPNELALVAREAARAVRRRSSRPAVIAVP